MPPEIITRTGDNLVRAQFGATALELRDAGDADDGRIGTLTGHFARFNEWTEIDSLWEGRFLERIAPGSFAKTIAENRDRMRVTLNHGMDPTFGDKPLGPIERLEEDDDGPAYDVPLIDTSYNRDLVPGLDKGLYGSSFRFRVMKEEIEQKPKASKHNPEALPERTIKEAQVYEFGPVTFPAYAGAEAGLRSMTDEYLLAAFRADPDRLKALLAGAGIALPTDGAASGHSDEGSRTPIYPPVTSQEWDSFMEALNA